MMVLIQTVHTITLWLNAVQSISGLNRGLSPRELVTGRGVDYNKDCRATFGAYVQATTEKIVTNNNTPRTHGCIALGTSGNMQGSLKCFDLKTGKVVTRRIIKQIPWLERTLKIANAWGRKSKRLILKDSITFTNQHGKKFDWENDNLSDLEVKNDQLKMIHPTIPAELTGIKLKSDRAAPSRVQVLSSRDITHHASDARVTAGLNVEAETNTETRSKRLT